MDLSQLLEKREKQVLLSILAFAFFLRIWKLGAESFWLDELHTMIEAAPQTSIKEMFGFLRSSDQHPPLFFFLERMMFTLFGRSEWSARIIPATAGTLSVYALYLLGKELAGRNLGLIAAAITSVNWFDIYYSREARGYSLVLMMAAFSFVFLVRLLKYLRRKDMWYYSLFALMAMYSHYFGIFLVVGQFCAVAILFLAENNRKLFIRRFLGSGILIVLGYLPWLPFLLSMTDIHSFWIGKVEPDFMIRYFYIFFNDFDFLKPLLYGLLIYYLVRVFNQQDRTTPGMRENPLGLSFVVLSVSLFVTILIPYLRSVLVVPMLQPRYLIVVLPIFLLAIAYGMDLIENGTVKITVFLIFIGLSLSSLTYFDGMYRVTRKSQFRQMTEFMVSDPAQSRYPVVNDRIYWHLTYYFDKLHFTGPILTGPKADMIDSLAHKTSAKYNVPGFWIVNAHGAGDPASFLSPKTKATLDSFFVLADEKQGYDAWAQLYVSKNNVLTAADFPPASRFASGPNPEIAVWGGSVTGGPIVLSEGNYAVHILSWGTPASDVFPHLAVYCNDEKVGDFFTAKEIRDNKFTFKEHKNNDSVRVRIELTNDFADKTGDRNAFIENIRFAKE